MSGDFYSINLERDTLNSEFGGGIPKNSLILIMGEDGCGKSVLCQRISYSLLQQNLKITYISSELNMLDYISQNESLDFDIKEYILDGCIFFVTMVPYFGKVNFDEDFLQRVLSSKKIFQSEIIIFDTLSYLLVKADAGNTQYLQLINFFKNLIYLNKTIIFTINPQSIDKEFIELLEGVSDIFMEVVTSELSDEIKTIKIKRFKRAKDFYNKNISFRVEPQKGILIEIGTLV